MKNLILLYVLTVPFTLSAKVNQNEVDTFIKATAQQYQLDAQKFATFWIRQNTNKVLLMP